MKIRTALLFLAVQVGIGTLVFAATDPALVGTPWPIRPLESRLPLPSLQSLSSPSPWVPSNPIMTLGNASVGMSPFKLQATEGPSVLWYRGPLGQGWSLEFLVSTVPSAQLALVVGMRELDGQGLGRIVVGPGLYGIRELDGRVQVYLNGLLVQEFSTTGTTSNPIQPTFWWELGAGNAQVTVDQLRLNPGTVRVSGTALQFVQFDLKAPPGNPERKRYLTVLAPASITLPSTTLLGYLPLLHEALESWTGMALGPMDSIKQDARGDVVVVIWADTSGGRHGPWVYLPAKAAGLTQTAAHELAHSWGALTSDADWNTEPWLFEGIADALANIALNMVGQRPWWMFYSHFGLDWRMQGIDEPIGRRSLGSGSSASSDRWLLQSYLKGHQFLWYLAHKVGIDTFQAFLRRPQRPRGPGTAWLQALEAFSRKPLRQLSAGWLIAGTYQEGAPLLAGGTHENLGRTGLMGYQSAGNSQAPRSWVQGDKSTVAAMASASHPELWPRSTLGLIDGVPVWSSALNVKTLAPNTIRELPRGGWLWKQGGWIVEASGDIQIQGERRATSAWEPWLKITMAILDMTDGSRLKITWQDGQLNEFEWIGTPAVPGLVSRVASQIVYAESLMGFEALIAASLLAGKTIKGVYLSRGGANNGTWFDEALGTVEAR